MTPEQKEKDRTVDQIVDKLLDPIPSTHYPIFRLGVGQPGTYYCMDKDNLKKIFKEALTSERLLREKVENRVLKALTGMYSEVKGSEIAKAFKEIIQNES